MTKKLFIQKIQPIINKTNQQFNLSLLKKKLPQKVVDRIIKGKPLKIKFMDFID